MLYKIKVLVGSEIRTKHMKAMWYLNQLLDFKRLRQLQGVTSIVLVSTALSWDVPVQGFCTILLPYLGTPYKWSKFLLKLVSRIQTTERHVPREWSRQHNCENLKSLKTVTACFYQANTL